MYCNKCGNKAADKSNFCTFCGNALNRVLATVFHPPVVFDTSAKPVYKSNLKRRLTILVLAVVVLIGAVICVIALLPHESAELPRMTRTPLTAAELLDLGEKYLLELNYEQALVQFLIVIEIEPMNPRGYIGAAEAYISLGKIDEAISILRHGYEITGDESMLSMLSGLLTEDELEAEPDMRALAEAYLKILEEAEHEISNIVIKDITGDGIPELIFTQSDYSVLPPEFNLFIWSFDEEPRLLFLLDEPFGRSAGGASSAHVIAGNNGRLDIYRSWGDNWSYICTHDVYLINNGESVVVSGGNPYSTDIPQGVSERAEWQFQSNVFGTPDDPHNNENPTYFINDVEMSYSEYSEAWNEIWNNEFERIGDSLLFFHWSLQNNHFQMRDKSKGFFESIAELESMAFSLNERERLNHMAHGAYTDRMVDNILYIGGFHITVGGERAEFFLLIDMDGDGVDELLVLARHRDTGHWLWNLFSYRNGRVEFLEEKDGYVHGGSEMYIVDDKYILWLWDVGRAQVAGNFVEYTGYDGDLINTYSYYFSSHSQPDENGEWIWEDSHIYSFNGQAISEADFQEFVNTLDGRVIPFEETVRRIDYNNIDLFKSLR